MAVRNGGMFIVILDDTGPLQIFHDIKHLPPERLALLELLDLGDIIGVKGTVRRTKKSPCSRRHWNRRRKNFMASKISIPVSVIANETSSPRRALEKLCARATR
jgi:lysyl-tRNA synthetase class II